MTGDPGPEAGSDPPAAPSDAPPNGDALTHIATIYRDEFNRFAGLVRLINPDLDPEDVVQEAFARTIQRHRHLRALEDVDRYIRATVVNLCHGRLRRLRSQRNWIRREQATPPDDTAIDSELLALERRTRIWTAVRTLPRRQLDCVTLRFYLDCSYRDIAVTLGISEGSVKSHLHRGLRTIAAELGEDP